MSFLPAYLESSALLKLLLPEQEGDALWIELGRWPDWVTSELTAVECRRALMRERANASVRARADDLLSRCVMVQIDAAVLRVAEHIGPRELRSLDAIHLATAVSMGDYPEAFITYDDRLAAAARELKLNVMQPGRTGTSRGTQAPRLSKRLERAMVQLRASRTVRTDQLSPWLRSSFRR